MPGRLAIDFGTCNTVAALWEEGGGRSLPLGDISVAYHHPGGAYHLVPSLSHYAEADRRLRVGRQVTESIGLNNHPHTFKWIKTYVAGQMKLPRRIGGQTIDYFQAGAEFLGQVLLAAGAYADLANEETAFTVPVEAFEHYQNWLEEAAGKAGVRLARYLDEPSAAALGYAMALQPGDAFMVFDLGGGTADASIVRQEPSPTGERRCRLLGKAGAQAGGSAIDQWLAREVARTSGRPEEQTRRMMPWLLEEAERVKVALSQDEAAEFRVEETPGGSAVQQRITRGGLEDLLETNGYYTKLNRVLDLAEAQARERGFTREDLRCCLMIGGSSLIPSVRRLVRTRYGELAKADRPFEAVALGAAAWVAGAVIDPIIRHAYALRPYDRKKGCYVFQTIVTPGTPYPCQVMNPRDPTRPLVLTIKASNAQQTRLGLQVFEIAHQDSAACGGGGDLVFDQNGGVRFTERAPLEEATQRLVGSPTFIHAHPPAQMGDPRFQASFSVDAQKRLCVTVTDLQVGRRLLCDAPMVKLS